MQYIQTKYLRPTNTKGARIKAKLSYASESLTMPYDHSLDCEQAHAKVAMALAKQVHWLGDYASGGDETGYVFALISHSNTYSTKA